MGIGENVGEGVGENTGTSGSLSDISVLYTPVQLFISGVTSTTMTVLWAEPTRGTAIGYRVYDADSTLWATVPWGTNTTVITGMSPSTSYTLHVVTYDNTDESSDSITSTAATSAGNSQTLDFEGGTLGTVAATPTSGLDDGFTGNAQLSYYTDTQVHAGTQAVELVARQGRSGFGYWGGDVAFDTISAGKGDVLYIKFSLYVPSTVTLSAGQDTSLKFIRFYPAGKAAFDIKIRGEDQTDPLSWVIQDDLSMLPFSYKYTTAPIVKGEWNTYIWALTLSDLSTEGGWQMWKYSAGVWTKHIDTVGSKQTLPVSTDVYTSSKIFSYWNGGANAANACDLHIGATDYTTFTDNLWVKGGTSGKIGQVDTAGSRLLSGVNRLAVDGQPSDRLPTEWTIGETITEYTDAACTPGNETGITATLSAMYPEKNEKIYMDDIVFYDYLPEELV